MADPVKYHLVARDGFHNPFTNKLVARGEAIVDDVDKILKSHLSAFVTKVPEVDWEAKGDTPVAEPDQGGKPALPAPSTPTPAPAGDKGK